MHVGVRVDGTGQNGGLQDEEGECLLETLKEKEINSEREMAAET